MSQQFLKCGRIVALILPVDLKYKGALLVLLWSTMMFSYENLIGQYVIDSLTTDVIPFALYYLILPLYLVIGLVADVCVGRYRVMVASIYCAFVGWLILCVSFYITQSDIAQATLIAIGFLVGTVGAAGIQSIAVPFNIDQLIGATADELSNVIYWHCFGFPLGCALMKILSCSITDGLHRQAVCLSGSGITIAVVIATYYLLRHHIDATPLVGSPIKLIVKVLNYAKKNKYPNNRSALTYWEESAPSRLDLGKDKYGGPFTEEEVEDVKTVLRLFPILLCVFGCIVASNIDLHVHVSATPLVNVRQSFNTCIMENRGIVCLAAAVVFPTCKAIIHTCICVCKIRQYIPSMLKKIGIGLLIILTGSTVLIALDIINYGATSNCTFTSNIYDDTDINYTLITLSEVLAGFGGFIILFVSLEFTVAQSPGTMRGLMMGIWYGNIFISAILSYVVYIPFIQIHSNCTLYYHIVMSVCIVTTIILYGLLARCYKLRTRNKVINIHHVVATIYEKYAEQSQQYKRLNSSTNISYQSLHI